MHFSRFIAPVSCALTKPFPITVTAPRALGITLCIFLWGLPACVISIPVICLQLLEALGRWSSGA